MSNDSFLPMRHTNYLHFALQAPFPPGSNAAQQITIAHGIAIQCIAQDSCTYAKDLQELGTTASRSSRWSAEWTFLLLTPVWRSMRFYQSLTNIYFPQSGQRHRQPSGV